MEAKQGFVRVRLTLIQIVIPEAPKNLIGDNASTAKTKPRIWDACDVWSALEYREVVCLPGYERYAENFLGMLHLAWLMILLRYL